MVNEVRHYELLRLPDAEGTAGFVFAEAPRACEPIRWRAVDWYCFRASSSLPDPVRLPVLYPYLRYFVKLPTAFVVNEVARVTCSKPPSLGSANAAKIKPISSGSSRVKVDSGACTGRQQSSA